MIAIVGLLIMNIITILVSVRTCTLLCTEFQMDYIKLTTDKYYLICSVCCQCGLQTSHSLFSPFLSCVFHSISIALSSLPSEVSSVGYAAFLKLVSINANRTACMGQIDYVQYDTVCYIC